MEDYGNQMPEKQSSDKSIKGYQIVVILLVVILIVVSFIYFRQSSQLKEEYRIEKDTLTVRINNLRTDLDNLYVENDDINRNLETERHRADSLMDKLQSERTLNRATVRKYENELGTMREIMRRYVVQIDSLNQLNRALAAENVNIRKEATSERLRADAAEEKASELSRKVQMGQVVRARDVEITALAANDRPASSAKRAERLRVDFVLSSNELAIPGERPVYARITGPDGYVMAGDTESLFDFEGDKITFSAMREVDYQNSDLAVGVYYNGTGIVSGTYTVEIFMDGAKIGMGQTILK